MEWSKNLISYSRTHNPGKCPKCKGEKVEVEEHIYGKRKSLTFTCQVCKASRHFDGLATK